MAADRGPRRTGPAQHPGNLARQPASPTGRDRGNRARDLRGAGVPGLSGLDVGRLPGVDQAVSDPPVRLVARYAGRNCDMTPALRVPSASQTLSQFTVLALARQGSRARLLSGGLSAQPRQDA